jgi:YD repeat-containing protein
MNDRNLAGNRLWKTNVTAACTEIISYSYNTNDQLEQESSDAGWTFNYGYDSNGSLTSRSSATETNLFAYSLEGRLATAIVRRMEAGDLVEQTNRYFYNSSGIRVRTEIARSINGGAVVNQTNIFLNDPKNLTGFSQVLEARSSPSCCFYPEAQPNGLTKTWKVSSLCPGRCLTFRAPPAALVNRRLHRSPAQAGGSADGRPERRGQHRGRPACGRRRGCGVIRSAVGGGSCSAPVQGLRPGRLGPRPDGPAGAPALPRLRPAQAVAQPREARVGEAWGEASALDGGAVGAASQGRSAEGEDGGAAEA